MTSKCSFLAVLTGAVLAFAPAAASAAAPGTITEFALPAGAAPSAITLGPNGNVWFTQEKIPDVGEITPAGVVTEFPVPSGASLGGIVPV